MTTILEGGGRAALVAANIALRHRAETAESRALNLELLLIAEIDRANRARAEADALYQMLPESDRPTS